MNSNSHSTRSTAARSRRWPTLLVAALILVAWGSSSWASTMRCGGRVIGKGINQGISMTEVRQRCGEPYDFYGNQWLYVIGNNVFRVYFNRNGDVRKVVSEIIR